MAALCKILALLKANKARGGDRTKKLFQFLNEIDARALGLGRVLEMAEDSATKWEYEAKIAKRFGFEQQLELPIPMPHTEHQRAAN
jgi:hypothetical protein